MAIGIDVRADATAAYAVLDALRDELPSALARGLNATIKNAEVVAVRAIAEDTGLKNSAVRDKRRVVIYGATASALEANLYFSPKRVPLIEFGARPTQAGVTYKVGRAGRTLAPSGFFATTRAGHTGAFRRLAFGPGARPERRGPPPGRAWLPIVELHGPSIRHVWENTPEIQEETRGRAEEQGPKNLEHELKRAIL
jgi:hypothetical protein